VSDYLNCYFQQRRWPLCRDINAKYEYVPSLSLHLVLFNMSHWYLRRIPSKTYLLEVNTVFKNSFLTSNSEQKGRNASRFQTYSCSFDSLATR